MTPVDHTQLRCFADLRHESIPELRDAAAQMLERFSPNNPNRKFLPYSLVCHMATVYAEAPEVELSGSLMDQFRQEVEHWYSLIPVAVRFIECPGPQPFNTMGAMVSHLEATGELLMKAGQSRLDPIYGKHRAVHDYFGHCLPRIPFGVDGEAESYRIHRTMFSPEVRCLVFSDVVLANAYVEVHGDYAPQERFIACADTDFI